MMIENTPQIALLPWAGNHASDMGNFAACDDYIARLHKEGKREEMKLALREMTKHGMGIDDEVTDAELDSYIRDCMGQAS